MMGGPLTWEEHCTEQHARTVVAALTAPTVDDAIDIASTRSHPDISEQERMR